MRVKTRFIKSVLQTANQSMVEMPWARGSRRETFVASRRANAQNVQALIA